MLFTQLIVLLSSQHTKRTMLEIFVRRREMEDQLIDNCKICYDRTMENVQTHLDLAKKMKARGLEDLRQNVLLVQQHRADTERLFSRDTIQNLKFCQVYLCTLTHTFSH